MRGGLHEWREDFLNRLLSRAGALALSSTWGETALNMSHSPATTDERIQPRNRILGSAPPSPSLPKTSPAMQPAKRTVRATSSARAWVPTFAAAATVHQPIRSPSSSRSSSQPGGTVPRSTDVVIHSPSWPRARQTPRRPRLPGGLRHRRPRRSWGDRSIAPLCYSETCAHHHRRPFMVTHTDGSRGWRYKPSWCVPGPARPIRRARRRSARRGDDGRPGQDSGAVVSRRRGEMMLISMAHIGRFDGSACALPRHCTSRGPSPG
jgi:hypothetical protein